MRYPPEHKQQTRERILDQAARLFRIKGYRGVGIDQIMAAAELTRGGFYAHFPSKEELFAEVLARESDFARRLRSAPGPEGAEAVVRGYLDPRHRTQVGEGCTLAALTGEVPRAGRAAKRAFAGCLAELAQEFERQIAGDEEGRHERALLAVATCVGAITLARGAGGDPLAEELVDAAREQALSLIRGD
ncbi:MAG: TetR/AcrR family transcriptional regulator [Myxococcota bacterium]|nr:TetR/AcrR family transcriptional regulator [Myxococcota bacterium]